MHMAVESARAAIVESELQLERGESLSWAVREQADLAEALVRLLHMRVVPAMLREGWTIPPEWLEREIRKPLSSGIDFMARVDGLLVREDEEAVLSWKTAASVDKRKLKDARIDMQGLSESWALESVLGHYPLGVQMVYVVKGRRLPDRKIPGQWNQHSPLIRGWQFKGDDNWAWAFEWQESDSLSGEIATKRLGKGWHPMTVSEDYPGGIQQWMWDLDKGMIQPEAGDCLDQQFVLPVPQFRKPADIERWVKQVTAQEMLVAMNSATGAEYLDNCFPQYTHSCEYPSHCGFSELCWEDGIADDPLGSGLYQIRVPNHPEGETE